MRYLKRTERILCTIILLLFVVSGILITISAIFYNQSVFGTDKREPTAYRSIDLYLNSLGVRSNSQIQEIIERYGEPTEISKEQNDQYAYYGYEYPDQIFYFVENQYVSSRKLSLFAIELKSNELQFGRKKIGIGTTREKILKVLGQPTDSINREGIIKDEYVLYTMTDGLAGYSGWALYIDFQDDEAISIMLQHSY